MLRLTSVSTLILTLTLALPAAAQTHYASFDHLAEGVIGNTYTEDGLVFGDLDSYLSSGTVLPFVAEDASATLAGFPGFSSRNFLGFSPPDPGPTVFSWGRFGSCTITPPGVRNSAVVNVFTNGPFGGPNEITLEAWMGGGLVASDSATIRAFSPVTPHVLTVAGVAFDQLRLVSSGSADDGANFLAFDSIVVEAAGPGTSYCASLPTSLGTGALISATGSRSIHANNMVLRADPVPNTPGLFYYGPNQIQAPFGDGLRCVGGSTQRLPVQFASGNALTYALDFQQLASTPTRILAGSSWNFQAFFRDMAAGGAGFNLSDGLAVDFTP